MEDIKWKISNYVSLYDKQGDYMIHCPDCGNDEFRLIEDKETSKYFTVQCPICKNLFPLMKKHADWKEN